MQDDSSSNSKSSQIKLKLDNHDVYGRATEQMELARIPRRCGSGPQVVLVHGKQGSGKTHLIHSMKQIWTSDSEDTNALFVSATFDKNEGGHSSSTGGGSSSALVDALEELCRIWAVSPNGTNEIKEYLDLVEDHEKGCHMTIPTLYNKEEMKGRGNRQASSWCCSIDSPDGKTCFYGKKLAIRILLNSICQPSRPVILFLDDFQFADEPSLDILNFILQDETRPRGFVLVVAYRDEVGLPLLQPATEPTTTTPSVDIDRFHDGHTPAQDAIEIWKAKCNENVHDISVQDLSVFSVGDMISGLLNRSGSDDATASLAEVVFHKTHGNPFCILHFLRILEDEGYLFYSLSKYQWEWIDVEQIQTSTSIVSDNVADSISASIQKLSPETKKALMVASCLGKRISFQILQQFFSDDDDDFSANLEDILDSAMAMEVLTKRSGATTYYWSHERVREGVYRMVSKHQRADWHLGLGQLAWKLRTSHPDDEWLVYLARDQFSKLTLLVSDKSMRVSLAKLNLEAAQLCISQSALHPAGNMLHEGINLLDPETRWEEQYDLCIILYTMLAETAHALGNHDASKRAVDAVLRHAKTPQDKSRVSFTLVQSMASGPSRDYDSAIDKTIELLAHEGVPIRLKKIKGHTVALMASLPRKYLDMLPELPVMKDEATIRISKLLSLLTMFALNAEQMILAQFAVLRCFQLSLDSGISMYTSTAVAVQGLILMHEGKKIDLAQTHGRLALSMLHKFEDHPGEFHVQTKQMIYSGIFNAVKPFHESLDVFMKTYSTGLATRDLEHGVLGGMHYGLCYLAVGLPLTPLEGDLGTFTEESKQFGLGPLVEMNFQILRQTILNLQGKSASPIVLQGDAIDAEAFLSEMEGSSLVLARRDVATFQLMLACIYGDLHMAEKMLNILEPFPFTDLVVARGHIRLMFMGLAGFALGRKRGRNAHRHLGTARKVLKHFEVAVKYGSVNAHPVLAFLQAEESPSREAYEKAIRTSARSGLMHLQAMINERAALYFMDHSEENQATFYLSKAAPLYLDWGATGKVAQLRQQYKCLSSPVVMGESGKRGVSVGLKGRKRVSLRDCNAIHEYSKFKSLRHIQQEDGKGSSKALSRSRRLSGSHCLSDISDAHENSSLGLGDLELSSTAIKSSNQIQLTKTGDNDSFNVSLSSWDEEEPAKIMKEDIMRDSLVSLSEMDDSNDDSLSPGGFRRMQTLLLGASPGAIKKRDTKIGKKDALKASLVSISEMDDKGCDHAHSGGISSRMMQSFSISQLVSPRHKKQGLQNNLASISKMDNDGSLSSGGGDGSSSSGKMQLGSSYSFLKPPRHEKKARGSGLPPIPSMDNDGSLSSGGGDGSPSSGKMQLGSSYRLKPPRHEQKGISSRMMQSFSISQLISPHHKKQGLQNNLASISKMDNDNSLSSGGGDGSSSSGKMQLGSSYSQLKPPRHEKKTRGSGLPPIPSMDNDGSLSSGGGDGDGSSSSGKMQLGSSYSQLKPPRHEKKTRGSGNMQKMMHSFQVSPSSRGSTDGRGILKMGSLTSLLGLAKKKENDHN